MSANPRVVQTNTVVVWDRGATLVRAGTIIDIPSGSDLEQAYGGPANLVPISGTPQTTGGDPGESEPLED
jgi:hypothetical protein